MNKLDKNEVFFRRHFEEFVNNYGGQWVVIANGRLIGTGTKDRIKELFTKAKKLYPTEEPHISPIPKPEEIECVL
jgi:hypothetical protein